MTTARRTPRQQRSRATVGFLLTAAAQVFEREGIATTTDRIAAQAGVSIGSLYQYFPHKQALLDRLVADHVHAAADRLRAEAAALRHDGSPPDEAIARLVDVVVELHAGRPVVHALDAQLHRVHAPAAVQRDRLRTLVATLTARAH